MQPKAEQKNAPPFLFLPLENGHSLRADNPRLTSKKLDSSPKELVDYFANKKFSGGQKSGIKVDRDRRNFNRNETHWYVFSYKIKVLEVEIMKFQIVSASSPQLKRFPVENA